MLKLRELPSPILHNKSQVGVSLSLSFTITVNSAQLS